LALAGLTLVPSAWANGWKTSRARFSPEGERAPRITISGNQVKVRHVTKGSGKVRGTALRGDRTYNFSSNGTYSVAPGRYQHLVYGDVPSGGSIESVLQYQ